MTTEETLKKPTKVKKPFDPIFTTFMRHWLKIAVFGTGFFLIFSIVGLLFFKKHLYEASSKLLISPVATTVLSGNEGRSITGYYGQYVQTQVDIINSLDVLETAINKLPKNLKKEFAPSEKNMLLAAKILEKRIDVYYLGGTHIVEISLESASPKGIAEIINNITKTYLEKIVTDEEKRNARRLRYLNKEKERVSAELKDKKDAISELTADIGSSSFSEKDNIFNEEAIMLQQQYVRSYAVKVEKENLLNAALNEAKYLKTVSVDPLVEQKAEKDSILTETSMFAYKKIQNLKSSLDGTTKNNPDRKYIEDRIKSTSSYLKKLRKQVKKRIKRNILEQRRMMLEQNIIKARALYVAAKNEAEKIQNKFEKIRVQSTKASQKILQGQQLKLGIDYLDQYYYRILTRISDIKLESRAPGRVTLESLAKRPDTASKSNSKKIVVVCFILSFGVIVAVCLLFDLFDNRIRSPKHIESALGASTNLPISDYLSTRTNNNIPFVDATIEDSVNIVSRAISSLAVRLDQERSTKNAKVFLFTGVDNCVGTTEIMLNTEYAMKALCGKGIIIEANFKHSNLCELTNYTKKTPGLTDILSDSADINDCIIFDKKRQIDIIYADSNSSLESFTKLDLSKLPKILDAIKQKYNYVLIDARPILQSYFTEYFVVNSDVVCLIIQGDRNTYKDLVLASNILFKFEVPAIAPILNWGAPKVRTKMQNYIDSILNPVEDFLNKLKKLYIKLLIKDDA